MMRLRPQRVLRCEHCHYEITAKGCPRCARIVRADRASAARNHKPDPTPHPCPRCARTVRGGVCPGPNC